MKKSLTLLASLFFGFLLSTAQEPEIVSPDLTFEVRDQSIAVMDDILYFPGHSGDYDSELWRSDGTEAGTYRVMDLNPTGRAYPHSLVVIDDWLYFLADSMSVYRQLFKTDGTVGGTHWLADVDDAGMENNHMLTKSGGLLYYRTYRPSIGVEQWASDGTPEGTAMVKDICESQASYPHELTDFNGLLIFAAESCVGPNALYRTDGTLGNTIQIGGNNPAHVLTVDDTIYFRCTFDDYGGELARTTGEPGSIEMIQDINPGAQGADIYHLTQVDSLIFFRASHADYGAELWAYNSKTGVTYLVKDIWPGSSGSSFPDQLVSYQGKLIFQAHDGEYGQELWISDGTEAGTQMLKNINEEAGGPPYGHSQPGKFYEAADLLFFSADDGINGRELWQTDGTEAGTVMVHDIGYGSEGSDPGSFTAINDYLYFHAYYNDRYRLYKLQLTETPSSIQSPVGETAVINLYPNPAEEVLLVLTTLQQNVKYQITDVQGKVVLNGFSAGKQEFTVDLTALSSGIYFFVAECNRNCITQKFVKR